MRSLLCGVLLLLACAAGPALASDELVTSARTAGGETIPYILTSKPGTPAYAVILMPGGKGSVSPRMVDGKLVFSGGGNFLIRSRELFADGRFVAVSTDATSTPDRMLAIIRDLQARYGQIAIYIIGTSRSTEATMALAKSLDGWVAGFVHSSSMSGIADFDPRGLRSRQLIVLHVQDACRVDQPVRRRGVASEVRHRADRDERRHVDRQRLRGLAHHGYNGIEQATVDGSRPGSPSPDHGWALHHASAHDHERAGRPRSARHDAPLEWRAPSND